MFQKSQRTSRELQGNSEVNSVFEIQLYSQNIVLILLLLLGGSVKRDSPPRSHSSIWTLQLYVQTQLPEGDIHLKGQLAAAFILFLFLFFTLSFPFSLPLSSWQGTLPSNERPCFNSLLWEFKPASLLL